MYQTGELGCIDNSNIKMRHLLSLRAAIYSKEFRDFICAVTGCDELTDRVDCSANAYTTGAYFCTYLYMLVYTSFFNVFLYVPIAAS